MTKDFLFSQINVPAEFTNKVFFFFLVIFCSLFNLV